MRVLINVVGGDAPNLPSGCLPCALLPSVLTDIEVKRSAVDLEDHAIRRPAEVRLLAGDTDVEAWRGIAGVAEDLEGADLGSAASTFDRQAAIAGEGGSKSLRSPPSHMAPEEVSEGGHRRQLLPDRHANRLRECPVADNPCEVKQRAFGGSYWDAAHLC